MEEELEDARWLHLRLIRQERKALAQVVLAFTLLAGALQILLFGFAGLVPLYFRFVEGVGL